MGVDCEYCIYTHKELVKPELEGIDTKHVWIKDQNSRVRIFGYIGTSAVIYALETLKADKVYIAGCDLYTAPTKYGHPYDGRDGNEIKFGLSGQKRWWWQLFDYLGDLSKIIPVSGPLVDLKKRWCAAADSRSHPISRKSQVDLLKSL